LAKHDKDDFEGSICHAHLATTIDRKAEFIQEYETCDTDKAGEKDAEDRVYPEGDNDSALIVKSALHGGNKPRHVEAGLYNHCYPADNGQDRLRSRFPWKHNSYLQTEWSLDYRVNWNRNNPAHDIRRPSGAGVLRQCTQELLTDPLIWGAQDAYDTDLSEHDEEHAYEIEDEDGFADFGCGGDEE